MKSFSRFCNVNHQPIAAESTMQQAKDADRMLWKKMSESTRGSVAQRPDGLEVSLAMLSNDPEVHFLMMPIPKASRPAPYDRDPKNPNDKKGKGKGKKEKDGKASTGPPEGCHHKTPQDKPICFGYNRGFCKFASDGKRMPEGFPCLLEVLQTSAIYKLPALTGDRGRGTFCSSGRSQRRGQDPQQTSRVVGGFRKRSFTS